MEQVGEENASRRGASANRWAADAHALALLPTIRMLMAAGFVSQRELANELNRRGIATARGGNWHRNTVLRMLRRLDLLTSGQDGIDNGLTRKRVADVRTEALRPTIRKLRKAGFVSIKAIAAELNERGIAAPRGGKWRLTTVTRLLQRLERLDLRSNRRHRR
jgi:Recombinase